MKLELEINSDDLKHDQEAHDDLTGLHVYASSFCTYHKTAIIIARPQGEEINPICLRTALLEMAMSIDTTPRQYRFRRNNPGQS